MSARRDAILFLLAALLPAAATGILGVRALRNEEAALSREAVLEVQREADKLVAAGRREIDAFEAGLPGLAGTGAVGDDKDVAALAERARSAAPRLAQPLLLASDGRVIVPREERAGRDDRVGKECAQAVSQLDGAARAAAKKTILESCEGARDAQGRYVWPVLAVGAAKEAALGGRLVSWIDSHRERMRAEEKTLLLEDAKRSQSLTASELEQVSAALGGARLSVGVDAAVIRAARGEAVQRAARIAREGPGSAVPVTADGVLGAVVALRLGGFAGWVATPETLSQALASANGGLGRPADGFVASVVTEMPARTDGAPEGIAFLGDGLGVRVRFAQPERLRERTTRSQRLLGGLVGGAVALALVLSWALYRRMRETRRTSDLRTSFVAGVSHELRTPLASVRMLSELLSEGRVEEDERAEVAEALAREAKRMGETVDRFMAYARSERGKLVAEKKAADVGAIAHDRVAAFRERHPEARVELDAEPLEAAVDRPQIEIVIDNLLENALKYAADGQPYRVSVKRTADHVVLSVSDAGPGIPKAKARRIFEAFERGDDRLSKATSGTGLGLFLVRAIARAHGGDVALKPAEPRGATFCVTLPLA